MPTINVPDTANVPMTYKIDRVRNALTFTNFAVPPVEGQLWPRGNMAQGAQVPG